MIFFPFLFFLLLFFKTLKSNGVDVGFCMLFMYVVTSLFGIILGFTDYQFEYENYSTIDINIIPSLVYCFMIGLCIKPFIRFNSNSHYKLSIIKNVRLFKSIVILYIIIFFSLLLVYSTTIVFIIAFGDFGALRQMTYEGLFIDPIYGLSGPLRIYSSLCSIIGEGGYFMIVFFFYSVCALKEKLSFNLLILLSSLSPVLMGFVNIDRSKMAYWFLLFVLSYVLFRPHIVTKRQKRLIKNIAIIFLGLIILYMAVITIARFGERESGATGGLLVYLGQPFINFCNIWDNLWGQGIVINRVFPITHFIFGGTQIDIDYVNSLFAKYGVHTNVFTSFLGVFLIDFGHVAAVFFPIIISKVTTTLLRPYFKSSVLTLHSAIIVIGLGTIVQCGIIAYYYETVGRVFTLLLFIYISKFFGFSGLKINSKTQISRK